MTRPATTGELSNAAHRIALSLPVSGTADAAADARQSIIDLARALARIAAQEDDAAERNEAGPAANSHPRAKRRKSP